MLRQRRQGGAAGQRLDRLLDHAHRQIGRIGGQRSHGKRAAAAGQQECRHKGGNAFGVFLDALGNPIEQCGAGGGQAMIQDAIPRVSVCLLQAPDAGVWGSTTHENSVPQCTGSSPEKRAN